MLVGQGFSLDSSQEETRVGCGLGSVPGFSVSPEFAHGPLMVAAGAEPDRLHAGARSRPAIAEAFPEQVKKSAVMYANYAATARHQGQGRSRRTRRSASSSSTATQEYNIGGEDDWKPFVQKLKDCGAEVVYFTGSPNPNFQNFLVGGAQLDYSTDLRHRRELLRPSVRRLERRERRRRRQRLHPQGVRPARGSRDNPATQKYLDIVGECRRRRQPARCAGDRRVPAVGHRGARRAAPTVTQDCVFDEIAKIDEWTGGGLHAPTNPASNMPPDCGIVLKLEGATFERVVPRGCRRVRLRRRLRPAGHRRRRRPRRAERRPHLDEVPGLARPATTLASPPLLPVLHRHHDDEAPAERLLGTGERSVFAVRGALEVVDQARHQAAERGAVVGRPAGERLGELAALHVVDTVAHRGTARRRVDEHDAAVIGTRLATDEAVGLEHPQLPTDRAHVHASARATSATAKRSPSARTRSTCIDCCDSSTPATSARRDWMRRLPSIRCIRSMPCRSSSSPSICGRARSGRLREELLGDVADVLDAFVVDGVVARQDQALLHDAVGVGQPAVGDAVPGMSLNAGWRVTLPVHTMRVSTPCDSMCSWNSARRTPDSGRISTGNMCQPVSMPAVVRGQREHVGVAAEALRQQREVALAAGQVAGQLLHLHDAERGRDLATARSSSPPRRR